ncbi:MAG: APC family permease [Halieaceae bacterium]|jgi:amino acid transporter|nr:APC family permease [Halieaceae bacterium]
MAGLKRVLDSRSVAAAGAGFAFATLSIVADVQVAQLMPGNTGWMAVIVAALLCILASSCFGELSGMFPTSAGVRVYIQKAFGEKLAIPLSAAYIFTVIAASGAEAYVFGSVFEVLIPSGPGLWFYILLAFTIVAAINYFGIEITARVQNYLSLSMFLFLVIASFAAIIQFGIRFENWYNPVAETGSVGGFIAAVALSVFLFAGFEWVTALSEETRDQQVISRGMLGAIGILCTVYALLNFALVSAVPKEVLTGEQVWTDGVNYAARPHVVFIKVVFGAYELTALIAVGLLSFLASMTSFNAGILTTSRFLYAMSRDKTMPKYLSKLHPEYFTPYAAALTLCAVAVTSSFLMFALGGFDSFTYSVAGAEVMMYFMAALCVLKLRKTMPDMVRPFRVPGNPVTTVTMVVGFGLMFVMVFMSPAQEVKVGLAILVAIIAAMALHSALIVPRLRAKKRHQSR